MEDLIRNLRDKKFQIELPSHLWNKIDPTILNLLKTANWHTVKYFNENYDYNDAVRLIKNDTGGVYIFYVSPEVIPERQRILMYVGRAHISESQNIRKRIMEYKTYLPPNYQRPKVSTMMSEWKDFLFCSYIELDNNELIDKIEKELINKLIPPFNDLIPDKTIGEAVKAAGLQ